MIVGVGIDIVDVERFESAMARRGERLRVRLYTPEECAECDDRPNPMRSLAARFAAKEAFSKALGTGMSGGLRWRDFSIKSEFGKPIAILSDSALLRIRTIGASRVHVSLSHSGASAIALVILES
jgi:holo-[acyl-carrier protein] synthase